MKTNKKSEWRCGFCLAVVSFEDIIQQGIDSGGHRGRSSGIACGPVRLHGVTLAEYQNAQEGGSHGDSR